MEQPDLFQARAARRRRPGVITDTPRARTQDPETSHEAAEKIKTTGTLRDIKKVTERFSDARHLDTTDGPTSLVVTVRFCPKVSS